MQKFYSHIRIGFNCKNIEKANKLSSRVQEAIKLQLHSPELNHPGENNFELTGYFVLEYPTKEEAVFDWLFYLELIGYNWEVKAPFIYEEFFSFEGERWTNNQEFKIPGITFAIFELTDRMLDYYDNAPLKEYEDVIVLESQRTREEDIVATEGYVSAISPRTNGTWNFVVYLKDKGQTYLLTEEDLKKA